MRYIDSIRSRYEDGLKDQTDLDIVGKFAEANNAPFEQVAKDFGVPLPNDPGFITTIKRTGGGQLAGGVGEIYGDITGNHNNALSMWAKGVSQNNPSGVNSLQDIADKPGLAVQEALGNAATLLLPGKGLQLVGKGLQAAKYANTARMVSNPVTQAALMGLPSLGSIGEDQRASGQEENLPLKYGAALGVGAIENLGGVQRMMGFNKLNPTAQTVAQEVRGMGKTAKGTFGKQLGRSVLEEGGEEMLQSPLEQYAGYKDPTSAKSVDETVFSGAMGAIGGLIGSPHAAARGLRHAQIRNNISTDLLNIDQPFAQQQNLAEYEREFKNKAGEDGSSWYNSFLDRMVQDRDARNYDQQSAIPNHSPYQSPAINNFMGGVNAAQDNSEVGPLRSPVDEYLLGNREAQRSNAISNFMDGVNNAQDNSEVGPLRSPVDEYLAGQQRQNNVRSFFQVPDANITPAGTFGNVDQSNGAKAKDSAAAFNAPSGTYAADPFNGGQERELTMGELYALQAGAHEDVAAQWKAEAEARAQRTAGKQPKAAPAPKQKKLSTTAQKFESFVEESIAAGHIDGNHQIVKDWIASDKSAKAAKDIAPALLQVVEGGNKVVETSEAKLAREAKNTKPETFEDRGDFTEWGLRKLGATEADVEAFMRWKNLGHFTQDAPVSFDTLTQVYPVQTSGRGKGKPPSHATVATRLTKLEAQLSALESKHLTRESDTALTVSDDTITPGEVLSEDDAATGLTAVELEDEANAPDKADSTPTGDYDQTDTTGDVKAAVGAGITTRAKDKWNAFAAKELGLAAEHLGTASFDNLSDDLKKHWSDTVGTAYEATPVANNTLTANAYLLQQYNATRASLLEDQNEAIQNAALSKAEGKKGRTKQNLEEKDTIGEDSEKVEKGVESLLSGDTSQAVELMELLGGKNGLRLMQWLRGHFGMPASTKTPKDAVEYFLGSAAAERAANLAAAEQVADIWGEGFDKLSDDAKIAFHNAVQGLGDLIYTPSILRQVKGDINGTTQTESVREVTTESAGGTESNPAETQRPDTAGAGVSGADQSRTPEVKVRKKRTLEKPSEVTPNDTLLQLEPASASRRGFLKTFVGLAVGAVLPQSKAHAATVESSLKAGDLKGALQQIASGDGNPAFRQLAKKLVGLIDSNISVRVVEIGKSYKEGIPSSLSSASGIARIDRENGKVVIWLRGDVGLGADTLLHETIHSVLLARYDMLNYYTANKKLRGKNADGALALYDDVWSEFRLHVMRSGVDINKLPAGVREAYRNIDEFITYALTDPATQAWMSKQKYDGTSLWGKFKEFVKGILGFGGTEPTWLDAALRVSNEVLDNAAKDKGDFSVARQVEAMSTGQSREVRSVAHVADYVENYGGPSARKVFESSAHAAKQVFQSFMSLHDLVEANKGILHSAQAWYKSVRDTIATRTKLEADAESIAARADKKGIDRKKVNSFISRSTFEQKWGYDDEFDKMDGTKRKVTADPDMKLEFLKLNAQEQQIVKDVFAHGEKMKLAKFAIMKELGLKDLMPQPGSLEGPYAPLKRFGNWLSVQKSEQLVDAEDAARADPTDAKKKVVEDLKKDPTHYVVSSHDTRALSSEAARNAAKDGWFYSQHFRKVDHVKAEAQTNPALLQKVRAAIKAEGLAAPVKAQLDEMITNMYLQAFDEHNARMSGLKRKNTAGYNEDMIRAFLSHSRAEAGFLANMKHGGVTNDAFYEMQREAARNKTDRAKATDAFNMISKHYAENLKQEETPISDALMALTSLQQLATNPAYHIQNLMQPLMVSIPRLAADFNDYPGAWRHLMAAYRQASVVGFRDINLDNIKNDAGLKAALEECRDSGLLDVGMAEDLGHLEATRTGISSIDNTSRVVKSAIHKLRQIARTVEAVNRISTAIAAYKMATANGKSADDAKTYAVSVLQDTQGDFSRTDAPLILKKIPKVAGQYRKFQLMMMAHYVKAANAAFRGATAEEKSIGKRTLALSMGHAFAAAGLMGVPLANLAGIMLKMFGDDDEPKDLERWLRENLGDDGFAQLLIHGPLMGIGLDAKLSQDKVFSFLPYADWDLHSKKGLTNLGLGMAGPAGSNLGKMADGVGLIKSGDYYTGLEKLLPSGVSNAMKAFRVANDGYTLKNGDIMVRPDDINGLVLAMDAIGLKSHEMRRMDWFKNQQYEIKRFYIDRTKEIQHDYALAVRDGDTEAAAEARDHWMSLQAGKDNLRMYFNDSSDELKKQPLSNLLKYPQTQAKREAKLQKSIPQ